MTVESFQKKHGEADAHLAKLCAEWRNELATAEAANAEAGEQIRAAIGQAELLMRKKMAKVRGHQWAKNILIRPQLYPGPSLTFVLLSLRV